MPDEPTIAQPAPSPCPECGTTRIAAEGLNTVRVVRSDVNLLSKGSSSNNSELWALVCPNCGYTSFYAKNPSHLEG